MWNTPRCLPIRSWDPGGYASKARLPLGPLSSSVRNGMTATMRAWRAMTRLGSLPWFAMSVVVSVPLSKLMIGYYYNYQHDTASTLGSGSDTVSMRPLSRGSSISATTISPPRTPRLEVRLPILAPDCSACGIRLDAIRYVCVTCGEGELWKENVERPTHAATAPQSEGSRSGSESSEGTAWQGQAGNRLNIYSSLRSRSGSTSTHSSFKSLTTANGSAASPTEAAYSHNERFQAPRGYELCSNCIEGHGIQHAKAARKSRKAGEFRHSFREKIWGAEGWTDVGELCDASLLI